MVGRNPPWSDLPQELLSAIAGTLTSNPISIVTFRSVCHSWRSSCPPLSTSSIFSPLLPLSMPFASNIYRSFYNSNFCSTLSLTIIYALHRPRGSPSLSPDTWLLFVDEFNPGKISFRKPFLDEAYSTPINFPRNINLLDFNVTELGRFHNLSCSTHYDGTGRFKCSKPPLYDSDPNKVVMFPNASVAITLVNEGTMGLYRLDQVAECRVIERETKHDGKGFRFDDILDFKGRVLGIDRRGRVYEIKYDSSEMTPFIAPIAGGGGRRKRLVESLGGLYLVVKSYADPARGTDGVEEKIRKIRFKVYELNEGKKKWIEISSLGDRSFSFSRNFSFSASSQELGSCVKNCILFTHYSFLSYSWKNDDYEEFPKFKKGDLDIGVYHLHNADDFAAIESFRGYSDALWPPPCWIWPIDRSKRIEIVETAIDEILDRIPDNFKAEVKRAGDSCDDFGEPAVMEFVRAILELREMVIGLQEIKFMNELRDSMDTLNQMENLLELARTRSRRTTDGIFPDNFFKKEQDCRAHVLRSTMDMLRLRDAYLLYLEERFTKLEMTTNSEVVSMLTSTK